ncbi:SDR family oxidoreductase [Reichenbachiella sp.]|uniref:SDR family oxidoreductase n=1 Tax=Reichenbachiella sp. TaxID=2184521 RepID=UPI003B593B00
MKNNNQFEKQGWTPERISNLNGKTYLITGTTSGTGFEAARILLAKGAKVVMLNRNPKKSEDTISYYKNELGTNIDVSYITVDLGKLVSVRQAAKEVLATVSRIDVLILNAAIAQVPHQVITADGFESQLATNHYGNFLLQALLFPLIEKSKGRIVTVGSLGYNMGIKAIKFDDMNWDKDYTGNNAYSQSKLAQIMSIYELQDRLEKAGKTDVKAYACHPGSSRTSLIKTSGSFMMRLIFGMMKLSPLTQSAEKGAYPQLMCATEEALNQKGFYGPTGRSNWTGPVGVHHIEPHAKDKVAAKKLWEVSEKAVGQKFEV